MLGGALVMVMAWAAPALAEPPAVHASFVFNPNPPHQFETVVFTSRSSATGEDVLGTPNAIASESWDFNNDDVYERTGKTQSVQFTSTGARTVGLRVEDTNGVVDFAEVTFQVRNWSPVASLVYSPASPHTGEAISFFSTSTDRDGHIVATVWDLDGDGKYNDGGGLVATGAFAAPGTYTVGVRVTDDDGGSDSASIKIVVLGQAASQPRSGSPASPLAVGGQILSPFPIVRISGLVRKRGVRLRLLAVDAPIGSIVSIRCRGHGCPFRRRSRHVKPAGRTAALPGARRIRIRRLGHRFMRPGATLKVFVTKRDTIGKYTRLKVRRLKLPARADRCLIPNTKQPMRCPGA
jgi:hypothetical protein